MILEAASKEIRASKEEAVRLSWALNSILSRVERGMRVELRFLPPKSPKPEEVKDEHKLARQTSLFADLERLEKTLEFPKISESPILRIPAPFVETPDKSSSGQKNRLN